MDFRFMERPKAKSVQIDLFYDLPTNVVLYSKWQKFLHDHQPKSLILWGQNDTFFTREGGEAYLKDLPNAEIQRLNSGHFAVEDCLDEIVTSIYQFYLERVVKPPA
jgi:pimeloyl-ACP methyl ester carboxylesterase